MSHYSECVAHGTFSVQLRKGFFLCFYYFSLRNASFATFCFTHAREIFIFKGDLFHRAERVEGGLGWKCHQPQSEL